MAAVTELATAVGTRAACRALFAPRASHYRQRRASICPGDAQAAAFTATRSCSSGTRNGPGAFARRTLPGSLARRCLCDVAR